VLPGVGPKTAYRLDRLNVTRVGELAVVPRDILVGLFGKVGRTLHDQANGIDLRPVNPHETVLQQSVSRRTSFEPATADMTFLHAMLDHLMERVCSWLRQNDRACKGVGVVLNYGDYESLTGRTSFRRATDSEGELKAAAHDRFERLYQRRLPLRLLGVELSPIVSPDPQPMLFVDPEEERSERLLECKDAIRRRFGFMAVLNGTALVLADRLEQDRENFRLRTPCLTR
jgi:DNA polymerase-4